MAALRTLGYLSEDLELEDISPDTMNSILFAVLQNIDPQNIEICEIAANAFARAAPFTERNFAVVEQREYIMS